MHKRGQYSVSEIVGTILVLSIITSSVTLTLVYYSPIIDEKKADATISSVAKQFSVLNGMIQDLVSQGINCSRAYTFVTDRGSVNIDTRGERFIIYYSLDPAIDFDVSGFNDGNENKFIFKAVKGFTSWPTFSAYHFIGDVETLSIDGMTPLCIPNCNDQMITLKASSSLDDSIKINIIYNGITVGRIWLFDAGSITFQLASSSGTREIVAENGAILQAYSSNNNWLVESPVVFYQSDHFVLNIIQLNGSTGIGGPGTYKMSFQVENRTVGESNLQVPWVRMQIFKSYASTWLQYFQSTYGFADYPNVDTTIELQPNPSNTFLWFTLLHSKCKATVGGIS